MQADYAQPLEYRFSEVSVLLARKVADYLKERIFQVQSICDVFAGCGVVGLELRDRLNSKVRVDFIELQQQIFSTCLERNSAWKNNDGCFFYLEVSRAADHLQMNYDVIVANPPFYHKGKGRLSPNLSKAKAHFFLTDDIGDFFKLCQSFMSTGGRSFFLFPLDQSILLEKLSIQNFLEMELMEKLSSDLGLFILRHLDKERG